MITQEKLYYSISEVSQITEIEAYTLRYWEKEFPKLKPKKSKKGQRTYTKKDIDIIHTIKELLYSRKYTIKGAREKIKNSPFENEKPKTESKPKTVTATLSPDVSASLKGISTDVMSIKKRLQILLKDDEEIIRSS